MPTGEPKSQEVAAAGEAGEAATGRKIAIICDRCKRDTGGFEQALRRTEIGEGFVKLELVCPHCAFIAHRSFSSPALDQARQVLGNFQRRAGRSLADWQRYKQKQAEFQRKFDKVQAQGRALLLAREQVS